MNARIAACLLGSAACLFVAGCDDDEDTYAYTHERGGYYAGDEPVLVERRSVVIDNTPRYVPIYRTGRSYYYTYNGRRFDYDYDGGVTTRTRVVSPVASRTYRTTTDANYDEGDRRVVRRSVVRDDGDTRVAYSTRRTSVEPVGERVTVRDGGRTTVRLHDHDDD